MPADVSYWVPSRQVEVYSEVKGSRFLAALSVAASKREAQDFISEQRLKHPDASHHCFGFQVGPPLSTMCVGCSDDGEPHNSAGRPILDVLVHSSFGDAVCVVTRWFGGTKLGRGGLVRAYGDAAKAAIAAAVPVEKVDWQEAYVELDYPEAGGFVREVADLRVEVVDEQYGAKVLLKIRFARGDHRELLDRLNQLTRGSVSLQS